MPASLTPSREHDPAGVPAPPATELDHTIGRRSARPLLWVLGALLMTLLLAVVVSAAFLIAGDDSVELSGTVTAEAVLPAGTTSISGVEPDTEGVVNRFAETWSIGDWTMLTELSNESVGAVAREWYVDGLEVTVVGPSVNQQGGEMLVVDPAYPRGLIFGFRFAGEGAALHIGELFFAGDAG